jgi:hypothetical protein
MIEREREKERERERESRHFRSAVYSLVLLASTIEICCKLHSKRHVCDKQRFKI